MNNPLQSPSGFGAVRQPSEQVLIQQNRVLRNTYMLLAVTMIPTVLGAWVGMETGLTQMLSGSPLISTLLFLGVAFGFFFLIEKNKESSLGVYLLLGFTFFMGLMLSRIVGFALGFSNGVQLVGFAAGGTGAIFFAMASLAATVKKDLSGMTKFLFAGVILMIVAGIANIWLQMPALMLTLSVLATAIFSIWLLIDLQQIVRGGETNYVSATLAVYMSIYNIFSNLLLLITSFFGGERE